MPSVPRFAPKALALFVGVTLGFSLSQGKPALAQQPLTGLPLNASRAKSRGLTSLVLEPLFVSDRSQGKDFDAVLQEQSTLVVSRQRSTAVVELANESNYIYTWYALKIDRVIASRRPPVRENPCPLVKDVPKALSLRGGEIGVAVYGGTLSIDGVSVTQMSNQSDIAFREGQRYLLVGLRCSPFAFLPADNHGSVFPVSEHGVLGGEHVDGVFALRVLEFETLSRFISYVTAR